MEYVDGFVLAVPRAKREEYRQFAQLSGEIFRECGALSLVECWADDVPEGKLTSFPLAVQCKEDEAVVFAWIRWPSKAVRDEGLKKSTGRMDHLPMPFDGARMIFGGFEVIVDA